MKDKMDILKEVGTTAAAHGSTALSEILNRRITLSAPQVQIIPSSHVLETIKIESLTIALQSHILSGLKGKIIYILEEKSAFKLIDIYQNFTSMPKERSIFTEMSMSLIKEIGNVVISSYAGALGFFLKKVIIPSLPVLINAPFEEIAKILSGSYNSDDYVLIIESLFQEPQENIKGNFWLILTREAADEIKNACEKILKDI